MGKCTHIKYYNLSNGTEIVQKKRYDTLDLAIDAAKFQNTKDKVIRKYVAYKCDECGGYHIGRGQYTLKDKDRERYKREFGIV